MLGHVKQAQLHDVRLDMQGERLVGSLFPLFDDDGVVFRHMVVTADSAKIALVPPEVVGLGRGLFRARRLASTWSGLVDSDRSSAEQSASLWHFDPWWVLDQERFGGHPAVPVLKGTNLPGVATEVDGIWFSRDLRRVTWYRTKKNGESVVERFGPELLRSLARQRVPESSPIVPVPESREWVLRPFWERF